MYHHANVMRPEEDEDESARRDRLNSSSHPNNNGTLHLHSPTQPEYPSYSPSKPPPPRPAFNTSYPPLPPPSHAPALPASPGQAAHPVAYSQSEYHPPRSDRPTSSYYDPTSDSGDRRTASWADTQAPVPQVQYFSFFF